MPVCAIACETDHIAPWKSSFNRFRQFGSRRRPLSCPKAAHIAGIVNPPGKDKYGHYTSEGPMRSAEEWKEGAGYHKGSWWPALARLAGGQSRAGWFRRGRWAIRVTKVLAPAPGTYVAENARTVTSLQYFFLRVQQKGLKCCDAACI